MKPSDRIREIRVNSRNYYNTKEIAKEDAIIRYLDEQYEQEQKAKEKLIDCNPVASFVEENKQWALCLNKIITLQEAVQLLIDAGNFKYQPEDEQIKKTPAKLVR